MRLTLIPRRTVRLALPAALALSICVSVAAQVSGAIFTTNADGTFVNGNVYDSVDEPYLNGGPRANAKSCTAAGLPNGDYYFQVTDPSGDVLLSSDGIDERRVTVFGGLVTSHSGIHATGTGRCGEVTVALAPFNFTPNAGGEYKAWLTSVANYDQHGAFLPRYSKTDNFKVTPSGDGGGPDDLVDTDGDGWTDDIDNCPFLYSLSNTCDAPLR